MKPQNILIVAQKVNPEWRTIHVKDLKVMITDFGLSKQMRARSQHDASISMTAIGGTEGYWAPEMKEGFEDQDQERIHSHFSMDSFAIGVIAYQLVTGGIEDGMYNCACVK